MLMLAPDLVKEMIAEAGDDPTREGLLDTPARFAKAWEYLTSGYKKDPKEFITVFDNPTADTADQLVVVPKIDFYSLCEHHLLPFYGQIHIGYLPDKKVLGLSKFARIADVYARRLQIQEGLGRQVANSIMELVAPKGVGVVIRGTHLCMRARGVEKQNSEMVTSVMLGDFREKEGLRAEFLKMIE